MTGPGIVSGSPKLSPQSQRDGRQARKPGGFAAALTTLLQPARRHTASLQEASRGQGTPQSRAKASGSEPAGGDRDTRTAAVAADGLAADAPARLAAQSATPPSSPAPDGGDEGATDGTPSGVTPAGTATPPAAPLDGGIEDAATASPSVDAVTGAGPVALIDATGEPTAEGEGERQRAGGRGSVGEGERQRAGGRGSVGEVERQAAVGPESLEAKVSVAAASGTAAVASAGDGVPTIAGASRAAPATTTPEVASTDVAADVPVDAPAEADPAAQQPASTTTAGSRQDAPAAPIAPGEGERQRAGGRGSVGEGERQRAGGRGSVGEGEHQRASADRIATDAELLSAAPIPDALRADDQGVSPQTAVGPDVVSQPSPPPPSAVHVDPSAVVDVDAAVAATGQGPAATQHAGGGSPAPVPLAPATSRIIELVERLRTEPPPQQLVVDLEQFGVGRLVISLRADRVFVGTLGGADHPDPQWWHELGDALDARGWSLDARDGQSQRERHQPQPQPQPQFQPTTPNRPLRRHSDAGDGLRL